MESSESGRGLLPELITEEELGQILGLSKEQIGSLRRSKQMPFVKLTSRRRVYLENDLMQWFKENRMTLNKAL